MAGLFDDLVPGSGSDDDLFGDLVPQARRELPAGVSPSEGRSAAPMGRPDPRLGARAGTMRAVQPYVAQGGDEPADAITSGPVADAALQAAARANRDPMLRPEFVDAVRVEFEAVPVAERLPALKRLAAGSDVRARAAKQILGDVGTENRMVADMAVQRPVMSGALAGAAAMPASGSGAPRANPRPAMPETGGIDQLARGETDQEFLARDSGARSAVAIETSPQAFADRARADARDVGAERFAEENPMLGALASGAARQLRGAVNFAPLVIDFAAKLKGVDSPAGFTESELSARLGRLADSYMPKVGRQGMGQAWERGEFAGWFASNLVAQAPQIAQSVIAAFVPGMQGAALGIMGGTAAGNKFAETGDSAAAATSGLIEVGTEKLPLEFMQRSFAALKNLPPAEQGKVLQAIGAALPKAGVAITANAIVGAIEESVAQVGNNLVDMARGEKKSVLDGVADAAVLGAAAAKALSLPAAAGALSSAAQTAEQRIAGAIDDQVANTYFKQDAVDGFVARAGDARFYDPTFVDPQQTVVQAGQQPAAPRVEEMPTAPFTPEQTAAMAAQKQQRDISAQAAEQPTEQAQRTEKGPANEGRPLTGQQPGAIGVQGMQRGALAAVAEERLRDNAQANAAAAPAGQPTAAQAEAEAPSPPSPAGRTDAGRFASDMLSRVQQARLTASAMAQMKGGVNSSAQASLKKADGLVRHWSAIKSAPEDEATRAFRAAVQPFEELFGYEVVPFVDDGQLNIDGFANSGKVWVNIASPDRSIGFTVLHEVQHLVRREAESGNSQAKLATQMLDQVWGMIEPEAKRAYAEKYLFRQDIQGGQMTIEEALATPKLRDEMLSDFMGKRADDREFWQRLAQKEPSGFKAFVDRWMSLLDTLIERLRGRRKSGGVKDVDLAIRNLERAKMVAETVVKEWAAMARSKRSTSVSQEAPANAREQQAGLAEADRPRGVSVEVAPNPDQPVAQQWRQLDQGQRRAASEDVMGYVWPMLMQELGWPKATYSLGSGVFEGEVNPSFTIDMPGATFADIDEMARLFGYVLDQKAMVAFDEADTSGGSQAGFIKVIPPRSMSTEQVDSMRAHIAREVPQATGDTLRNGAVVYGNFSQWSDTPLDDQQFFEAIRAAVDKLPDEIEVTRPVRFRSEYIEPASRDAYLEGTRYGGEGQGSEAGRVGDGRPRGDPGRLRQIAQRAIQRRDDAVRRAVQRPAAQRPDAAGGQGPGAGAGQEVRDRPRLSYGRPREGATSVTGYHFSREDRSILVSSMYGTGLAGAEAERLAAADQRVRSRVYFYVDRGTGINPEYGVGGRAHRVQLTNLYDADEDALRLGRGRSASAFELAVLEAGFDGYFMRDAGPSAVAVLIGQHAVPVEQMGGRTSFRTDSPVAPARPRQLSPAERIGASRALPAGQLSGKRWASMVRAVLPAEFSELSGAAVWQSDDVMYKDELARRLGQDGEVQLSERDDEMGAFSPFANEVDEKPGDDKLTEDELADLNAELADVMGYEQAGGEVVARMEAPSDAALKSVGIMAEAAYRDLEYQPYTDTTQEATISFEGGRELTFYLTQRLDKDFRGEVDDEVRRLGVGAPLSMGTGVGRGVTEGFARAWNRRVAASVDLMSRGFDLASAVPPAARGRVIAAWKKLPLLRGAFEFGPARIDSTAKTSIDKLQQLADSILGGSRFEAKASSGDEPGWFTIRLRDTKTGADGSAQIQYVGGANKRLVMHTQDLEAGSSMGKPFYQVAFAFGHAIGVPVNADPMGLTGINGYRRTEQMISAAARAGSVGSANPGVAQRIYGWRAGAKTDADRDRNLARLALAAARNAAEVIPQARDLTYDVEDGSFGWRRGARQEQPAEAFVAQALKGKDARAAGISRSTLARAAVTFQAVDGTLKLDDVAGMADPILYSAREAELFPVEYAGVDQDGGAAYVRQAPATTGRMADVDAADQRVAALRRLLACVTRN